jgi:hypothetical protein
MRRDDEGWAMTDEEIGERIRGRGLEVEYVRELLASLGHDPADGFGDAAIRALEEATLEQRRSAALRTLHLGGDDAGSPGE